MVGLRELAVLNSLGYDYEALEQLMAREEWTTVHVFWAEKRHTFHARNAFPPGGVREDRAEAHERPLHEAGSAAYRVADGPVSERCIQLNPYGPELQVNGA